MHVSPNRKRCTQVSFHMFILGSKTRGVCFDVCPLVRYDSCEELQCVCFHLFVFVSICLYLFVCAE